MGERGPQRKQTVVVRRVSKGPVETLAHGYVDLACFGEA